MLRSGELAGPIDQPKTAERLIVGYSTKNHLILDIDKAHNLFITIRLVRMIQHEYPYVGDCLISESSWDGFHCIFDSKLPWYKIIRVCSTLQGLGILNRDYIKIRRFREDLTLRVSSVDRGLEKSEPPKPTAAVLTDDSALAWQTGEPTIRVDALLMYYKEYEDELFSGIANYLDVLSRFRDLKETAIRLC